MTCDTRSPRGLVLVAVMVVVALAALLAASLLFRIRAEVAASVSSARGQQAFATAMSGIQTAAALLQLNPDDVDRWSDSPDLFQNRMIYDDGGNRWYFTVYTQDLDKADTTRFGVQDEASLININTAPASVLTALPNMTPTLVDALMDYVDADATPRPQGAEQDYYDSLGLPYHIRNGPLGTVDELLLVRGFDASLVYGAQVTMQSRLDASDSDDAQSTDNSGFSNDSNSMNSDAASTPGSGNAATLGLRSLVTVWSWENNVDAQGKARININTQSDQLSKLNPALPKQTIDFIAAYIKDKKTFTDPSQLLEMTYTPSQSSTKPGSAKNTGSKNKTAATQTDSTDTTTGDGKEIESGVTKENLAQIVDQLTTTTSTKLVGRININTASTVVLMCLPGMDESLAQQIVQARSSVDVDQRKTIAWIVSQGVVDAAKFKQIAPFLTARSRQFRVRCVGFAMPSGRFRSLEAVVDVSGTAPRIVYLRDTTRNGPPVPLDVDSNSAS